MFKVLKCSPHSSRKVDPLTVEGQDLESHNGIEHSRSQDSLQHGENGSFYFREDQMQRPDQNDAEHAVETKHLFSNLRGDFRPHDEPIDEKFRQTRSRKKSFRGNNKNYRKRINSEVEQKRNNSLGSPSSQNK